MKGYPITFLSLPDTYQSCRLWFKNAAEMAFSKCCSIFLVVFNGVYGDIGYKIYTISRFRYVFTESLNVVYFNSMHIHNFL